MQMLNDNVHCASASTLFIVHGPFDIYILFLTLAAITWILIGTTEGRIVVWIIQIAVGQGDLLCARGLAADDPHRGWWERLRAVDITKQFFQLLHGFNTH